MVTALIMLSGAFSLAGLAVPTAAQASTMVVDQCNVHVPGTAGATTALRCTVTVVNTISGTSTRSRTTVTRLCTLGPCSTPNGTFITDSVGLVTVIQQCNGSDNDASHAISCYVNVINNIGRGTSLAQPLTAPTVNQCVGSGTGGGGVLRCSPSTATGTTVTQCNGSGNGGGGAVRCTVDPRSKVSRAIPITVKQCNGSGNPGGAVLTCYASVITRITDNAAVTVPKPTSTPTRPATTTPAKTSTTTATRSQSSPATSSVVAAPAGSTGGTDPSGLIMLVAALVLIGVIGALLYRRYAPDDLFARFTAMDLFRRPGRKH
jgi:cell division septation protein DedD